jgi:hypothetical protein
MILPRAELYVNEHEFALHVWQIPGDWQIM